MMGLGLGAAFLADMSLAESILGDSASSDEAGLFSDDLALSKIPLESATRNITISLPARLPTSVPTPAPPASANSGSAFRGLDQQQPVVPQARNLSSPFGPQRSSAITGAGIGSTASSAGSADPAAVDYLHAMSSAGSMAGGTTASQSSPPTSSASAGIRTGGSAASHNQPAATFTGAAEGAKANVDAAASTPDEAVTSPATAEADTATAVENASAGDFTGQFTVELRGGVSSERLASRYGLVHESAVADAEGNVNIWRIPDNVDPQSRVGR